MFRRLGLRIQPEIDYEHYALKTLGGDFRSLPSPEGDGASAKQVLETVRRQLVYASSSTARPLPKRSLYMHSRR